MRVSRLLLSNTLARPPGAMRLSIERNHEINIPISLDESKMPVDLSDTATASYLHHAFIRPYSEKSGGYLRLENTQRNYLTYRITLDVGRLQKRNCTIGPKTREVQSILYTWFGVPSLCREIYNSMIKNNIKPTAGFFDNLLMVHAKRGDDENWKKFRSDMVQRGLKPTTGTYNSLLVLISTTKGTDGNSLVRHALRALSADGIPANAATITSALSCCGDFAQGRRLLLAIGKNCRLWKLKRPLDQNVSVILALIGCCIHRGEVLPASDFHEQLLHQGLNHVNHWNILFRVYRKAGDLEQFLFQTSRMSRSGVIPNTSTYIIILMMFRDVAAVSTNPVKERLVVLAEDTLKQAILSKHTRAVMLYEMLIEVYMKCGKTQSIIDLQESMSRIGLTVTTDMKNKIRDFAIEESTQLEDNFTEISKSEGEPKVKKTISKKPKIPTETDLDDILRRIASSDAPVNIKRQEPKSRRQSLSSALSSPPSHKLVDEPHRDPLMESNSKVPEKLDVSAPNILRAFKEKSKSQKVARQRLLSAALDAIRLA